MKIEYVRPFVESARSVMEHVTGSPATVGSLSLLGPTFAARSINLAARVTGSLHGDVVFSMSTQTAQELAALVTGEKSHGFGQLLGNGLAEMAAMCAENARPLLSEMGLDSEMSSPIMFRGLNVEFTMSQPALAAPVETRVGRVDISVAVQNDR